MMLSKNKVSTMINNHYMHSVCHLLGHIGYGGRETLLVDIATGSNDLSLTVYAFGSDPEMQNKFETVGIEVEVFDVNKTSIPCGIYRLYKYLRNHDFQLIHPHGPNMAPVGRVLGKLTDTPVSSIQHGKRKVHDRCPLIAERATRFLDHQPVAVAEPTVRSFADRDLDRWKVIENGLDIPEFQHQLNKADKESVYETYGIDQDSFLILHIGRFIKKKRQEDILAALAGSDGFDNVCLLLIGGRGNEDPIKEAIRSYGVEAQVMMLTQVDSVHPFYAASDAFVFPSSEEGQPIVLFEAMAAGLPIISTDIPSINTVVDDGQEALLVPPQSPEAIRDSLQRLIDHKNLREQLSKNARERVVSEFSAESMVEGYEELYDNVV